MKKNQPAEKSTLLFKNKSEPTKIRMGFLTEAMERAAKK
jgi:hypothetical protein